MLTTWDATFCLKPTSSGVNQTVRNIKSRLFFWSENDLLQKDHPILIDVHDIVNNKFLTPPPQK